MGAHISLSLHEAGAAATAAVASLGILVISANGTRSDSYQPLMRATIGSVDEVEWSYTGEVIATSIQGRFCAGLLCAHGLGDLGTDGGWTYSGTFRYGDIVGQGHGETDDGDYEGFVLSSAYPGGRPPLCGEPKGAGVAVISWSGFTIEVLNDREPCSGDFCQFLQCLKDWTSKAKSQQTFVQDEARQANQWHDKIRAEQRSILGRVSSKTIDKVSVAGTELRDYLTSRGWRPRDGAEVHFQRVWRPAPNVDAIRLYLGGDFQVPYTTNPIVASSELLPLEIHSGATNLVVKDAWALMDLSIKFTGTGYELSLNPDSE